jgi:hypothetical protein
MKEAITVSAPNLQSTVLLTWNPDPEMTTLVPPDVGPLMGSMAVTTGVGSLNTGAV